MSKKNKDRILTALRWAMTLANVLFFMWVTCLPDFGLPARYGVLRSDGASEKGWWLGLNKVGIFLSF